MTNWPCRDVHFAYEVLLLAKGILIDLCANSIFTSLLPLLQPFSDIICFLIMLQCIKNKLLLTLGWFKRGTNSFLSSSYTHCQGWLTTAELWIFACWQCPSLFSWSDDGHWPPWCSPSSLHYKSANRLNALYSSKH